ncbi:MAG: hypothetical protein PHR26_02555 [Candidatus ainarchaeum sp.]|nr:hypothetical protein [Candidatus ainarchaeum sp.]MDD3975816.1 hypothetical protein [Candidatus ainarchaeum sp.]
MDAKKKTSVKKKVTKSALKKPIVRKKTSVQNKVSALKRPIVRKKVSIKKKPILKVISKSKTSLSQPILIKNINDPSEVRKFYEKHYSHSIKKKSFFDIFCKSLWFPICVVFFIIFSDFILKLILHNFFSPVVIYFSKQSIYYGFFILFMAILGFGAYISLSYESVKRSFSYNNFIRSLFKISLIFLFCELVLLIFSYFTILVPYLILFGLNGNLSYLIYLILWSFIKFILFFIISIISFILFSNVNYNRG